MIIVDSHQDLASNIIRFGRDYTLSAYQIRELESSSGIKKRYQDSLLGYPEYQSGKVALIFSTLYVTPKHRQKHSDDPLVYDSIESAHQLYMDQVDLYHRFTDENPDKFILVTDQGQLKSVLDSWEGEGDADKPVGLVILMEGAEGVRNANELELWWNKGVRIIGLAWAGTRFCGGTREPGPLTKAGFELLEGMAEHGFVLDISHMDQLAVMQALDHYPGQIIASHSNAKELIETDSNRFLPDVVIAGMIERKAVIGVVPYNLFLKSGWKRWDPRTGISLDMVVNHIDYICQMAGSVDFVGIGSDFDGGFGVQSTPEEIDTIADLRKLIPLLEQKGYTKIDIKAIFGENWIRVLRNNLPDLG